MALADPINFTTADYNVRLAAKFEMDISSGTPVNPRFMDHSRTIEFLWQPDDLIKLYGYEEFATTFGGLSTFDSCKGKDLLDACKDHREEYCQGFSAGKKTLTVMHALFPFYESWPRRDYFESNEECPCVHHAYEQYYEQLLGVLGYLKEKDDLQVVLLESPLFYPRFSSKLVEQGLFDWVHFTTMNRGVNLETSDVEDLSDVPLHYLAGGLPSVCLDTYVRRVVKVAPDTPRVLVPELIFGKHHRNLLLHEPIRDLDLRLSMLRGAQKNKVWNESITKLFDLV
ncbi:MAG: hypothetical protein QF915_04910, partial [Candidatus Woesearchaeota archaeon]|nr:hypothetical protein [Candidatus Woesearchaeota archaeon]